MSEPKSNLSELFLTLSKPFKEKLGTSSKPGLSSERIRLMENSKPFNSFKNFQAPARFLKLATLFFMVAALALAARVYTLGHNNQELLGSLAASQEEKKVLIKRAEKEKANLKQAIENYKREQESVLFDLKKANVKLASVVEEKSYLEEILVAKAREIEDLRGLSPEARAAASGNNIEDLAKRLKDKESEISKLNQENQALSKRIEQIYATTNQKMTEINIAKIALEDTISKARNSIDQQWNTVNLGSITVADSKIKNAAPKNTPRKAARKEGQVLAVNLAHDFVIVDLGKVDGIKQDTSFIIQKNNQDIATLAVLEIRDVMTACNIVRLVSGQTIEINDSVSIRKK